MRKFIVMPAAAHLESARFLATFLSEAQLRRPRIFASVPKNAAPTPGAAAAAVRSLRLFHGAGGATCESDNILCASLASLLSGDGFVDDFSSSTSPSPSASRAFLTPCIETAMMFASETPASHERCLEEALAAAPDLVARAVANDSADNSGDERQVIQTVACVQIDFFSENVLPRFSDCGPIRNGSSENVFAEDAGEPIPAACYQYLLDDVSCFALLRGLPRDAVMVTPVGLVHAWRLAAATS